MNFGAKSPKRTGFCLGGSMSDTKYEGDSGITAMLQDRKTVFSELHTEMALDELFLLASSILGDQSILPYLMNFPEGFPAKIPSITMDAVMDWVDHLLTGETLHVRALMSPNLYQGEGKERRAKNDRDEVERILKALLARIESYSAESPLRPWALHTIALGLGVLGYPISRDQWPEHPFRVRGVAADDSPYGYNTREPRTPKEEDMLARWKRSRPGALPFDVHAVHPATFFFDPYHEPIENAIEEKKVNAAAFAKLYPHLELSPRGGGNDSMLVTYCSPEFWGMWLDGIPLLKGKNVNEDGVAWNTTGVLWYKMAMSGHGYLSQESQWVYRIQGLVRAARDEIRAIISDFNIQEFYKTNYVFPGEDFLIRSPKGEAEADQYHKGIAAKWKHGEDVERIREEIRNIPQGFFSMESLTRSLLEGHTKARVLGGTFEGGETASGIISRQSLARGAIQSPKKSMEQALAGMLTDMVWMHSQNLKEPLLIPTVNGYETLKPGRIPELTRLLVDLSPQTQEERTVELQDLLQRKGAHAASTQRILDADDKVEDKKQELINIDSDLLMTAEQTRNMALEEVGRRFTARIGNRSPATNGAAPEAAQAPSSVPPTAQPPVPQATTAPPPVAPGGGL